MEREHLVILIKKWLAGKATPQEQKLLEEQWHSAVSDDSYLESLTEDEKNKLQSAVFQNIWQRIRQHEPKPVQPQLQNKHIRLAPANRILWLAAAILLLPISMGIIYLYTSGFNNGFQTIRTTAGERRQVVLPDQSVVIINGNSSVRYASAWDKAQPREVWLEGEAYFSVQHTSNNQKFIVHTPDKLQVEVLGTKFNVSNRQGDTRIVLQEGKVKVSDPNEDYIMKPGEAVSYSAAEQQLVAQVVQVKPIVSWKDKIRLYRDVPIQAIFKELKQSHGIRVQYRNQAIRHEVFNGSVPNDSIELLFEKMEKLYQVKVTRENGVYVIE